MRTLAALARFLVREGQAPRTKSELVRTSLEVMHDVLANSGVLEPIASLSEALEILERLGYTGTTDKVKMQLAKALAHETQQEALVAGIASMVERAKQAHKDGQR